MLRRSRGDWAEKVGRSGRVGCVASVFVRCCDQRHVPFRRERASLPVPRRPPSMTLLMTASPTSAAKLIAAFFAPSAPAAPPHQCDENCLYCWGPETD
jgi:hypothetical protein